MSPSGWRRVAVTLLLLALWGTVAPYAGPPLGLVVQARPVVEVVDHVVPGMVLLAVGAFALAVARLPLEAALAAVLAGLWMTATHVPLLVQVGSGAVSLASALWHSVPGILLLIVASAAAVLAWGDQSS